MKPTICNVKNFLALASTVKKQSHQPTLRTRKRTRQSMQHMALESMRKNDLRYKNPQQP